MFKVYYEYNNNSFYREYYDLQQLIKEVVLEYGVDSITAAYFQDANDCWHELEVR